MSICVLFLFLQSEYKNIFYFYFPLFCLSSRSVKKRNCIPPGAFLRNARDGSLYSTRQQRLAKNTNDIGFDTARNLNSTIFFSITSIWSRKKNRFFSEKSKHIYSNLGP